MRISILSAVMMGLAALSLPRLATADTMALEAVLQRALEHNRQVHAADHETMAREHEEASVRGRFGPVLRVEASAMLWDSDNVFQFDMSGFEQMMGGPVPPMELEVRGAFTAKTTLMAIQPLTQLFAVAHGYAAAGEMAAAARHDALAARRKVELEVTRAFFANMGAQQMRGSVVGALEQIDAFEEQTRKYLEVGLIERDALLKVQLQRQELRKAKLQTEKGIELTRAALNMMMGAELDAPLELSFEAGAMSAEPPLAELWQQAVEQRPELQSGRAQMRAAKSAKTAAIGGLLPEISAVLAFHNQQGMGDMMRENELFGGLMLNWNLWEWGAAHYQVEAAEARAQKADAHIEAAEEGVRLEVQQRRLELQEARQQLEVAQAGVTLAEEHLRLELSRYEAQQSTATDLLAAQTSRLRARNDETAASMTVEMARRALNLATGHSLLTVASTEQTQ